MEWLYILMPISGVYIFWPGLVILGLGVGIIGGFFGMGGAWMVTPGLNTPVSRLSGGNVQKVLVGRELAASPIVLMTAYAVRGLDINTSYTIYNLLNEQKEKGVAVIYVGEDLDVLLELCDRILVLCGGKANGMLDARTTTKEEVGLRMTNLVQKEGK